MQNGGADGTGFDSSLLEGLPLSQFNWNEWNVSSFGQLVAMPSPVDAQTYFEQLDRMFPNNGTANGNGNGNLAVGDQAFVGMQ